MVTLTELESGNLEIVLDEKDELENILAKEYGDENVVLHEILDNARYIGNGWSVANYIGMTDAPRIALGEEINDEGRTKGWEKLWWFPNYMVEDFTETLKEKGRVIFLKG